MSPGGAGRANPLLAVLEKELIVDFLAFDGRRVDDKVAETLSEIAAPVNQSV